MNISIENLDQITIVRMAGELDANTAPVAQQHVLPLARAGSRILLDLTGVPYMSSAGLRVLLSTYRNISATGGSVVLIGLADEIRDTMSVTGFLGFFRVFDTLSDGLQALS